MYVPAADRFTPEERAALAPYFTNLDGPVFALVNLPEVVKGALFARYSRSAKSLRRLFLDEFVAGSRPVTSLDDGGGETPPPSPPRLARGESPPPSRPRLARGETTAAPAPGTARAEQLYARVFSEYGDDSVAQLGGVHLACEGASNLLTKVLEWGRLMAYLEQSTRYVPYDDRPGGRYRYHVPVELEGEVRDRYVAVLDHAFATYAAWLPKVRDFYATRHPRGEESEAVWKSTLRAKALDTLRGLLPAATTSNVGLYGTGQAYEALLLRMRAHPLAEARHYADLMLGELRQVIPAFLTRVDLPERGVRWSAYLAATREATRRVGTELLGDEVEPTLAGAAHAEGPEPMVTLTDWDPEGEVKVVAAALYAVSDLPDDVLLARARGLTPGERRAVLRAYVGDRENRRHKPGRAFERTAYRFDVLADYGAFRDLQRHRLLTLEWQRLSTRHGYLVPEAVVEVGAGSDWARVMEASAELASRIEAAGLPEVAAYAVAMAYRVRFYMAMNAREAMHVIELRTAPQGHPAYRRVCQAMHRLIAERHPAIAAAMVFADHSEVALERLEAERAAERRRARAPEGGGTT
jgi:thymidylate synthase ThyX